MCSAVPSRRSAARTRNIGSKKTIEETRDQWKPDAVFYDADAFNLSWMPALRAMWSLQGQLVMVPTPGQPSQYSGLGAIND